MNSELYTRQMQLPEIGEEGQHRLATSKIIIIGAGGLGCPALTSLAAAGIGSLAIVDGDSVHISNLHRQHLYQVSDCGRLKTEVIAARFQFADPNQQLTTFPVFLDDSNAESIVAGYDIILDATDNQAARRIIERVSKRLQIPVLFAGIFRYQMQLAWFIPNQTPTYSDLFPAKDATLDDSCSIQGVLGMIPSIAGNMQALECIKWICGIPSPTTHGMLYFDLKTFQMHWIVY